MPTPSPTPQRLSPELEAIAKEEFGVDTLETRRSDSLDFHSVAVWCIRSALQRAYELGQANPPTSASKRSK